MFDCGFVLEVNSVVVKLQLYITAAPVCIVRAGWTRVLSLEYDEYLFDKNQQLRA